MNRAAALLLALAPAADGVPDEPLLDRIEARVEMPQGAAPLADYARHYAFTDGGRRITGVYLRLGRETPGRRAVPEQDLPLVLDGGCGVVTVEADPATAEILSVACNGEA